MTENTSTDALSVADAAYIVRDGVILLECVEGVDDTLASEGGLVVHTEDGAFSLRLALGPDPLSANLADNFGGAWGEHPQYPAADWRQEVESHDTRLGYWDWAASKLDEASAENGKSEA